MTESLVGARRRTVSGLAVVAVLALAGCGNWSQEDIRFLGALPTRADLRVEVPASANASALCASRPAALWLQAKPTSDGLNAGVDFVLRLVDAIRRIEPTERRDDERRWGPWDDDRHPGFELQARIVRSEEGGALVHRFLLEVRRKGQGDFLPFLTGVFQGPSAQIGKGSLEIAFEVLWTIGMNDADTPRGSMAATYDRTADPRRVTIQVDSPTAARPFEYRYAGSANGTGGFVYVIPSGFNSLEIASSFDGAGAGKAEVTYRIAFPVPAEVGWTECWDAAACLVYVADPGNYSCDTEPNPPCSLGAVTACAAVPPAP